MTHYTEVFQFFLHIPVAVFEDISDEQIISDCLDMEAYPIGIIKSKKHPLFVKIATEFKKRGITQDLKLIILVVGYDNPYLA
jgi:hypothetical protein